MATFSDIVLTTTVPTFLNNTLNVVCGGISSLNLNAIQNIEYGVCYSNLQNPTYFNGSNGSTNLGLKNFEVTIYNVEFGATYYFRAYARNFQTGEVIYGNEQSLAIPLSLSTLKVKNISTDGFFVDIKIGSNLSSNSQLGICYSTSQNPTVANTKVANITQGSGIFTIQAISNINKDTTYYVKSYVLVNNQYYYGNQLTVRTTGYVGGTGGYVFYDKGELTNGWRYLEAAPSNLTTQAIGEYFKWSCNTNFIPNISIEIGTGLENTNAIRAACNFTNVAATMCNFQSLNNKTDWFLPSLNELKELYKLKRENVISSNFDYYVWSSSQSSNGLSFALNFSNNQQVTFSKSSTCWAWQVRRF